jgi:hypothetical protein
MSALRHGCEDNPAETPPLVMHRIHERLRHGGTIVRRSCTRCGADDQVYVGSQWVVTEGPEDGTISLQRQSAAQ